jgi:hypothetical protein
VDALRVVADHLAREGLEEDSVTHRLALRLLEAQ